jgi:hypothetical protein
MFLLSFRVSDNGHPSRVSCDCLLLFVHALRFIFIVQESHRVWETKFSLLWSLNLIKNQIRKRITIIISKIKIKWQKHIVVPNFCASWQITFYRNKSLIFYIYSLPP